MHDKDFGLSRSAIEQIITLLSRSKKDDIKTTIDGSQIVYDKETNSCKVQPNISRRAFLGLIGGLTGLVAMDSLMPGAVGYAYADDGDDSDYGFIITILSKSELGIIAIDVSKGAGPNVRDNIIADMEVTIRSLFAPEKVIKGKTDKNGIFTTDVKLLAENANDELADRYEFWGTLLAHKDGYRDFEVGMVRFASGPPIDKQGFVITTQAHENKPYARMVAYDGFDIQYNTSTIRIASGNDIDHTLTLKVSASNGKQVTGSLVHNNTVVASTQATVRDSIAQLDFKGPFNKTFRVGAATKLLFKIDNTTCEISTKLVCDSPELELQSSSEGKGQIAPWSSVDVSALDGSYAEVVGGANKIVLPKEIPIIGGLELSADLPFLPVYVVVDLNGKVVIATNIADFSLLKDPNGKGKFENWKERNKENWDSFTKKLKNDKEKGIESVGKALENSFRRGSEFGAAPFVGKMTWKLTFEAALVFTLEKPKSNRFTGNAMVTVGMAFGVSGSKQFLIWVIPFFLAFNFSAELTVAFVAALMMTGLFKSIDWLPGDTQVSPKVRVAASISAGVGVSGLLAIGVRGFGYIQIQLKLTRENSKPFPHVLLAAGLGVEVFLQAFCFSAKKTVYDHDWPKLYDNWSSKTDGDYSFLPYLDESLYGGELGSAEMDEEPQPVSDATLKATAEFSGIMKVDAEDNEEITYSLLNNTATNASCDAFNIIEPYDPTTQTMTYDISQGVKPLTDAVVYESTYSDPRNQVIVANGQIYLLRIATIEISSSEWALDENLLFVDPVENPTLVPDASSSVSRARILIMKFDGKNWSTPSIIDFPYTKDKQFNKEKLKRGNMYDYDFQAVSAGGNIHICLVSGSRAKGDKIKWYEARNNMVGSYLCYNPEAKSIVSSCTDFRPYGDTRGSIFDRVTLSLGYPRITFLDKSNAEESRVVAFFFGEFDNGEAFITGIETQTFDLWAKQDGTIVSKYTALNEDGTTLQEPNGNGFRLLSGSSAAILRDCQLSKGLFIHNGLPRVLVGMANQYYKDKGPGLRGTTYEEAKHIQIMWGGPDLIGKLTPYPGKEGGFLSLDGTASPDEKGRVRLVHTYDVQDRNEARPEVIEVGRIKPNPFTTNSDGKWIFTTEVQDGTLPGFVETEGGEGVPQKVELYQILGAVRYQEGGRFTEFFPIAQVSHKMDGLTFASSDDKGVCFFYNSISSDKESKANICYVTIPWLASLQIDGAAPQEIFLGVKDKCHLVMNVNNTGNLPIKSFAAQVLDKNGKVLFDLKVDDLKTNLVPNTDMVNADGTDYEYTEADKAGLLLPGTKRLYRTTFEIPANWHGTVDLSIRLVSLQPAHLMSGVVEAYDNPHVIMQVDKEPSEFNLSLDSGEIVVDGVGSNNYTSWTDEKGVNNKPIPGTGDATVNLGTIAALGAALGLGGTLLSAKQLRSSNNTNVQNDDSEE